MVINGRNVMITIHEIEKIDGEAIVYTVDGRIITMNKVATFIWEIINDANCNEVDDVSIAIRLIKECGLDMSCIDTVCADVSEYIEALFSEKMLIEERSMCDG